VKYTISLSMKLFATAALAVAIVHAQDTWEYGDLSPPEPLIEHINDQLSLCPPRNIDLVEGRPIPTNTWWGNLVTCDSSSNATAPIWANPFAMNMETSSSQGLLGISLGYPFRSRYFGDVSTDGKAKFYGHVAHKEVVFSATEFARTPPILRVTDWSDLGVRVAMTLPSSSSALASTMVSGMAFFTTSYTQLTPRIAIQVPIQSVNGFTTLTAGATLPSGRRFVITTVSSLRWVLYTSSDVTLSVESNQILRTTTAFTGTIRIAPVLAETPIAMYDAYKDCVVQGATIEIVSDEQYQFQFQTTGDCSNGLLHYALPHQMETMDPASVSAVENVVVHSTTRGEMRALVTKTSPPVWTLNEKASVPISFYPQRRLTAMDAAQQDMLNTLIKDIRAPWSIATRGSFYFNGKAALKYASLCLMANDPVIVGSDLSLLRRCLTKLEAVIKPFVDNTWYFNLKYDRVYGGIVSAESFVTNDMNADFGNSVYNDHHFHYGYWIYTSAIINFLHPTWSRLDDLNTVTRLLLRDVANPNSVDPFFPKYRAFDWFRGHSYSHGVTTFADGKDQESTSEDINMSYALMLYGQATGHARMAAIGKLMVKLNARAVQRYFLMDKANTVHPEAFKRNKAPGIYFDNKVDYATWFSAEKYCIHGIQMVPITPVTEFVRTRTFIQEEWDDVLSKEAIVTNTDLANPWLSLLYANYARLNKQAALNVLQQTQLDDGLTRSWALYMASQLN
jgi:endo-1,3(4)-beta-glucanase